MHESNYVTLCTDLIYIVDIWKIVYGISWKSKRRSWIRKAEEVELYI